MTPWLTDVRRIVLVDQLNSLKQALKPMNQIQSDYEELERKLLEQERREQRDVQGGLRASLRDKFGGRTSPQSPENRTAVARRKWKQIEFSFLKLGDLTVFQTNLSRHLHALSTAVGWENLGLNLDSQRMLQEVHAKLTLLMATPTPPRTDVPMVISKITPRQREKVSCLFVDDMNISMFFDFTPLIYTMLIETDDSVMAQSYAELIKLWTLDNLADSPFGNLSSAGLHVLSSLIKPTLFSPTTSLCSPGGKPCTLALTTLFPGKDIDEVCRASFVGSLCSEVRHVKARTYAHVSRGLCAEDFTKFDLIIACNEEIFLELEALHDIVTQMAASSPGQILPTAKLRLLRLPDLEDVERVEEMMVRFARDETSWWERPKRKMGKRAETKCAFRTRQGVVAMRREELMRNIKSLEDVSVFVEPIDGKYGEENLVTLTGKYGKMDKAFEELQERIPSMRNS